MINSGKIYIIIFVFSLITGCATTQQKELPNVFFPSPPEPARMQFLTYLTGEKDIAGKKSAFEAFVTGAGESKRRLDKPYGVAVWNGKIYVSDVNQGVIIFDLEKKAYGELQGAQGLGKLIQPVNIRIDSDGTKYVSDPIRGQVVVFNKNDFYVTAFGSPNEWKPVDAVPYEELLYVADMKNAKIVVLDKKSGSLVRQFGQEGELSERLNRPTNIAFDSEGHLFVSDAGRFQIVKYDRDGHFLGMIGVLGTESGTFARPRGIAIDRENRIYAVDAAFANVQLFNKDGNLLLYFGKSGYLPGDMNLPSQVVVDYDNIRYFQKYVDPHFMVKYLVIVANQFGNKMINIYAFGKEQGKKYPTDAELLEALKEKLKKAEKEKPQEINQAPEKDGK
jgi:hypothetical protein